MKRRLFFILSAIIALIMVGCRNDAKSTLTTDKFWVSVMDSCEYIRLLNSNGDYYGFAHKGNCRFCKERRQKELEKFVKTLKEE